MKVLITTDTYFPIINGVVTSTNNLYREIKARGHEVRILALSHTGEEKVDGDIYYLKSLEARIYPGARIKMPFHNSLVRDIIDWQPDIVHSQTEFSTMVMAKKIASRLDIPHIHTYHTMYEDYLSYIFGGKLITKSTAARITRFLLNSLDAVVAPTNKVKEVLLNYGVNSDLHVVPTGIDLSRFQRNITAEEKEGLGSKLGIKEDDKVMVYIGRIAEEKNIIELINYLPSVMERVKNIKLLIVGGGPYLDCLKQSAKELDLHNIIFAGMVRPEEVYKYYRLGDVFVTASTSETQGLTYLEALSCGCPVICRYDRCVDGVIQTGENGFTYKNSYEFAEYAAEVLLNDNLRIMMAKRAEEKAYEYSSKTFANTIMEVYNEKLEYSLVKTEFMSVSGM